MGLAFKPDIDDLRESPALYVNDTLKEEGFSIVSVEPNLESDQDRELTGVSEAIQSADIIVFLVAHSDFKGLAIDSAKVIIDFVGLN
jgi:UDP-N-acetyl-D-mannosaminuronic acid dehydrogenase